VMWREPSRMPTRKGSSTVTSNPRTFCSPAGRLW
jgi:hypothetical protein